MNSNTYDVIRHLRNRAQAHHEYLSTGERETRTKYALIDPILRSLGWDTEDPAQVKLEYGTDPKREDARRVDYALFQTSDTSKPHILIEAKGFRNIENAETLQDNLKEKQSDQNEMWNSFSILGNFDDSQMVAKYEDGSMFPGIKKQYLAQLDGYMRSIQMNEGYGVITNGDEWVIYDVTLPGGVEREPKASVSLFRVEDSIDDCIRALNILKRES